MRPRRLFGCALALILAACGSEADSPAGGGPDGSTVDPLPTVDGSAVDAPPEEELGDQCADVCEGVERDYELELGEDRTTEGAQKWATCFSCRCKSALKAMPSPEDLECSNATGPLKRWRPSRNAAGRVTGIEEIDANGTDTTDCLNPGMAAAGCDLQARFKRMLFNDGNTEFQMVCRKRNVESDGYYEYLIIGHNQQNGATCFWQAQDDTFKGEAIPKLDLTTATPAEKAAYTNTFYLYSEGPSTCTGCHANDAFLLSPYLRSAWSIEQARMDQPARRRIKRTQPYKLVTADQAQPQPVVREDEELTAPGKPLADDCGGCHRVVKGSYCSFAIGALGESHGIDGLTPEDDQALFTFASPLLHWMPPTGHSSLAGARDLQQTVEKACYGE